MYNIDKLLNFLWKEICVHDCAKIYMSQCRVSIRMNYNALIHVGLSIIFSEGFLVAENVIHVVFSR